MRLLVFAMLLVVIGCSERYYDVYQYTCWNGGVVIYDEKLVDGSGGWETLEGYRPERPIDTVCQFKLIGKHKKG